MLRTPGLSKYKKTLCPENHVEIITQREEVSGKAGAIWGMVEEGQEG